MGGGGSSSGGATDWSSNLSQGGYTQPSSFDWATAAKGLQQGAATYANSAQTPNFMTGTPQGYQPASSWQAEPFNVGEQGEVIGTDKRIYDYHELQALQDALRRIEAQQPKKPELGAAKYWYVDPRASMTMPTVEDLYRYPEGATPSF